MLEPAEKELKVGFYAEVEYGYGLLSPGVRYVLNDELREEIAKLSNEALQAFRDAICDEINNRNPS